MLTSFLWFRFNVRFVGKIIEFMNETRRFNTKKSRIMVSFRFESVGCITVVVLLGSGILVNVDFCRLIKRFLIRERRCIVLMSVSLLGVRSV